MRLTIVLLVAVGLGCNTSRPKADEMSVEEHRRAAEIHEAEAEEHAKEFDPTAVAQRPRQVWLATPDAGIYNPTLREKLAAERHEEKAQEHREMAAELAQAEQSACAQVEPGEKVSCPVVGPLASVERVADGVRATFVDPARRDEVLAQLRCHIAFVNARGLHELDRCALDVVGLTVAPDGGNGILIETKKRSEADDLFTLLQAQVPSR